MQIKSLYSPQSLLVYQLKFPFEKIKLFTVTKFCVYPTPRLLPRVSANAPKVIGNWSLTLQTDNYLQFTKVDTRKGMNVIWALDTIYNIFVYALIYALVWKKEKVYSLISEVVNIDFWQIWYFEVKGTGWVGLELSIIFMETVGRFDMWVTLYTGILTLAKLKYFMSKGLSTKTL